MIITEALALESFTKRPALGRFMYLEPYRRSLVILMQNWPSKEAVRPLGLSFITQNVSKSTDAGQDKASNEIYYHDSYDADP